MNSAAYWQKRAAERMHDYQAEADKVADELSKEYIRASNYITSETEKILRNFRGINGISVEEAELLLADLPDKATLDDLKSVVEIIPDSKTKREMLDIINSPAYSYRIRRFEELQKEFDVQTQRLARTEIFATQKHYKSLCEEAYLKNIFEVQKGTGIGFSFSKLSMSRIEEILKQNWSGKLFSERIWGRESSVNEELKKELLVGFLSGRSNVKTAKAVEDVLSASAIDARRLVRTESTYIANAAEMESYKELDIDKYEFVATLDMRTSDVCSALDGKTFPVKDGVPGVNMPPMHPWCRSTTIAVIDGAVTKDLKRRARDPETGELYEVPSDMTYEQWKKELDTKHGEGYTDKRRKIARNEKSDRKQYEKYISVLGKENMPKTFDLFQDLKYNNSEVWEDIKYYALNKDGRPIECVKIDRELSKLGMKKGKCYPTDDVRAYILPDSSKTKEPFHIMQRMKERLITDDEVRNFKESALFMFVQWNGKRRAYYSSDGISIISQNNGEWIYKSAWKKDDFDDEVFKVLEVLKKYGK